MPPPPPLFLGLDCSTTRLAVDELPPVRVAASYGHGVVGALGDGRDVGGCLLDGRGCLLDGRGCLLDGRGSLLDGGGGELVVRVGDPGGADDQRDRDERRRELDLPRATRSEMVSDPLAKAETTTLRRAGAATARGARATSLPAHALETEADVAAERGAASIARADRVPRGGFRGSKGE